MASWPRCCWTRSPSAIPGSPSWPPGSRSTLTGSRPPGGSTPMRHRPRCRHRDGRRRAARRAAARGDPRRQRRAGPLGHRRDRPGHVPVPPPPPTWCPGPALPVRPPVRSPHPRRKEGQGDSYLRGYLGQAATGAAGTATFLGERHGRISRRRGRAKAQVAVARSILVIIWHLLADPGARFADLGPDYYASRTDKDKKIRNHIRQLQALGMEVTITPAASTHTARAQARPPHQPGSAAARPLRLVISGQDGGGPGRLALLGRRVRPGPEAAERPHLGTARPYPRSQGDRRA